MWKVTNAVTGVNKRVQQEKSSDQGGPSIFAKMVNFYFCNFMSRDYIFGIIIGTVPSMFIYLLIPLPDLSFCFLLPGAESAPIKNRQQFH